MARIYVSTDASEAQALLDPRRTKGYIYHGLEYEDGERVKARIGFHPLCSIEWKASPSHKIPQTIAADLVKVGLFVAIETEEGIERCIPEDRETRDLLCQLAIRPDNRINNGQAHQFMFFYSNRPSQIREEIPWDNKLHL